MKSSILYAVTLTASMFFYNCAAQIEHGKTVSVTVYGNCGMCEKTIEKAALQSGVAKADWDQDTKIAQLTFDSTKTNADEILQRIAAAGYDSDKFHAPNDAYTNLSECCQYDRPQKIADIPVPAIEPAAAPVAETTTATPAAKAGMVKKQATPQSVPTDDSPLGSVYAAYFGLKDALVGSDAKAAAAQATSLSGAIKNVKMDALTGDQHTTWMKYQSKLSADADRIKGATDIEKQRGFFVNLSENMIAVMKVVKTDSEIYVDHCPMANDGKGANWLSKDKSIKNPYYGDAMLTCGKVKETLKQ